MASKRRFGQRRLAVVSGSVLGLFALAGAVVAGTAAAAAPQAVAAQAAQEKLVAGTPCTYTASSCVDLDSQRAWLIKGGKVVRGPVKIASGGNGEATPIGHSLRVYRKDKNHKSLESKLPNGQPAPMPWSVFFEDGGIAFHSGSPNRSSGGCIHLNPADAQAWYNTLQIGDQVQVVKASQELPKHKGQAAYLPGKDPAPPGPVPPSAAQSGDHGDSGDSGDNDDSDGGDHGDHSDHGDSGDDD
ncbi:MAG TPA: L,D-transpeptidase [Pseudonocardia sp.]|uniref:L,D-transpeptidase n=1 Tax=Pseudonocardia sp. TaxID=60912 RepID=UPI002F42D544